MGWVSGELYDASWVEQYFDEFGAQEWDRLVKNPSREVQLAVHNNAIRRFVSCGDEVLEIGAGAGRFTQTLSQIGAKTTVTDISLVQLELNIANAKLYDFDRSVSEWKKLDVCDMSCFAGESFDAVLCIGGPLSYVLDRRDCAIAECIRVTRPGGAIIFGVMSLWGTIHQYLDGVLGYTPEDNAKIIETGDLTQANSKFANHFCHMFRSDELREFLQSHGLSVEFMSASSGLSAVHGEALNEVRADEEKWNELLRMEILACQQPGYLDAGTHLIAAGRKANRETEPKVDRQTLR